MSPAVYTDDVKAQAVMYAGECGFKEAADYFEASETSIRRWAKEHKLHGKFVDPDVSWAEIDPGCAIHNTAEVEESLYLLSLREYRIISWWIFTATVAISALWVKLYYPAFPFIN